MSLLSSIFPLANEARSAQMSTLELLENENEQVYALWVAVPRLSRLPSHLGTPDIFEASSSSSSLVLTLNFQLTFSAFSS